MISHLFLRPFRFHNFTGNPILGPSRNVTHVHADVMLSCHADMHEKLRPLLGLVSLALRECP